MVAVTGTVMLGAHVAVGQVFNARAAGGRGNSWFSPCIAPFILTTSNRTRSSLSMPFRVWVSGGSHTASAKTGNVPPCSRRLPCLIVAYYEPNTLSFRYRLYTCQFLSLRRREVCLHSSTPPLRSYAPSTGACAPGSMFILLEHLVFLGYVCTCEPRLSWSVRGLRYFSFWDSIHTPWTLKIPFGKGSE